MSLSVSFAGAGNLAWHLAPVLDNAGYPVREVYSRNPQHAQQLVARLYDGEVKASLDFSTSPSQVFILAVADDAIEQVAREIILPDGALLLHTSGSQPLDKLSYAAASGTGVFYPLQSFTKGVKVDFRQVPVFIEGDSAEVERELMKMAGAISRQVFRLDSEKRLALHLAAVFASNFTNYMLTLAHDATQKHQLDYNWLKPLIAETINKTFQVGPEQSQTGPARRGDFETLDRHMKLLQEDSQVAELYRLISQQLVDRYGEETEE
ncbi:MAG: DUF2520 domain-containing protein [Flammeovirgaceae bacterium]|nr:MAG: DUF2520 domain-containing protein [Flammeovirgaceae bacterium]